ncbi:MAG: DUF421 domain-containing protein [Geodermatophilaceae bacterium]|nr:DUF421 domain-containing protein [Geodermatophilaceae bacterium]
MLRTRTRLQRAIDDRPRLLMRDGKVLDEGLRAVGLTEIDLHSALRAANVHRYHDVDAIVLEKTGSLTVLHHAQPTAGVEDRLLTGVSGADRT